MWWKYKIFGSILSRHYISVIGVVLGKLLSWNIILHVNGIILYLGEEKYYNYDWLLLCFGGRCKVIHYHSLW